MKKLQAAMEYLMTYGWAILIIALALGVLYSLGVFNPNRLKPVGCFLPAPFSCQIQSFKGSNGNLSILLGQGSGQTITITGVACVDNSRLSNGLPSNNADWFNPSGTTTIGSGGTTTLTNIYCINPGGSKFNGSIGSSFAGSIIIKYSYGSTATPPYYYTSGAISAQINTQ